MLNATKFTQSLRTNGRLGPSQLLALILVLMIMATFVVALRVHFAIESSVRVDAIAGGAQIQGFAKHLGPVQTAVWCLLIAQLLIAGIGGRMMRRAGQQLLAVSQREVEQSQALLERLSIATQAAGIYCWELDWKTYAITWDESRLPAAEAAAASRRHFGVELGSDLFKWVHPDDQHAGGKAMAESLARGEDHVSFRYRLVLPDKSIRHVQAFARTYCDAAGKPQRSLGVSWDVTAEVEATENAARNAAKERDLFERLSVATQAAGLQCWEFDFKQEKLVWLDYGSEHEGITRESVQAAGDANFARILPEDLRAVTDASNAAMARQEPMITARYRSRDPDGTLRHTLTYQRFFYDEHGQRVRGLGANLDITESFQRQAELEALSIRFAIATRAAKAGVWELQERSGEVWWDETMYVIASRSPETFRPSRVACYELIHPDDVVIAQAAMTAALRESNQLHVRYRICRPDGSTAHIESLAAVVTDPRTSERRLVGISLDISERVEAEQRERLLQKQLLEASHQSGMAEVATGVLHNVGNVLNSLGVASSTAQGRLKACQIHRVAQVAAMLDGQRSALAEFFTSDPRGKRLPDYLGALGAQLMSDAQAVQQEFDAISGHVQYLRDIVQAQQSFARVGGAEDAVNVRELVETALTLKAQELNGAEITRDIAELPIVLTDRFKLLQIIVNFIANACDAMAADKSTVPRMAIRGRIVLGQLEIAVEDSGIGIPPDLLPRVWEFGFTTKAHGHGFGLHSSAVAAQQLGGTIAADSAGPGLGACFSVKIPFRAATESSHEAVA